MSTWNGIQIVASLPRLYTASEFARQNPSGISLHATCVETAALDLRVAMDLSFQPDPSQIGNILQQMVDEWRADNPNVSAGGASSYADATEWLQEQGFTVEANVTGPNWWAELQRGLSAGCGYLVGTCNAQALPGDEPGVQCHGYSAQGILADGRILCGDPDNMASQVLMPTNPVGHLVAYTEADMNAAGVLSLTKVHPMTLNLTDLAGVFALKTQDANGEVWHCTVADHPYDIAYGILDFWRVVTLASGSVALPVENSRPLDGGRYEQWFERFGVRYDPGKMGPNLPLPSLIRGACYLIDVPGPAAAAAVDVAGIKADLHGVLTDLGLASGSLADALTKLGA